MGAEPYFYFVPYQANIGKALEELRQREFQAGRYNPVIPMLADLCPIGPSSPAPGAQHDSIEEAMEEADADGTRSILDLDHVAAEPDFGAVTQLEEEILQELYDTAQPTRQMILDNMDFFEEMERGQGIYIVAYQNGKPAELFFAGYSFD